ncbi:hypothetical protein KUTeg_007749 [Tegillarca granosa]|uniref:USP domain-containing protein n=1 Tax=Tegillarca granosa TaxID=220873 RepID=A0ABQ9FE86_TEGGR|nr:hypothetical protein KUTeg_007749 [Tegillarca granosa]
MFSQLKGKTMNVGGVQEAIIRGQFMKQQCYMLHDDGSSMTGVLYWILRNILDAEQKKLSKNYGVTEPLVKNRDVKCFMDAIFKDTSFHKDLQNDCHSFLISLLEIIKRDNKMFNKTKATTIVQMKEESEEQLFLSLLVPTFDHDEKPRETTRKLQYKLFGVIIHLGNLEEGHYITYVRSADESHDWLLCDGDDVSHCSKEVVFDWTKTCAYILFYHKEG